MTISRLSDNEQAWIEFLRLSSNGTDPAPDLASGQLLRRVLSRANKRKLSPVYRDRKTGKEALFQRRPWIPRPSRCPRNR
jgi:hypothetical protein